MSRIDDIGELTRIWTDPAKTKRSAELLMRHGLTDLIAHSESVRKKAWYALADEVRAHLREKGVELRDEGDGTTTVIWRNMQ